MNAYTDGSGLGNAPGHWNDSAPGSADAASGDPIPVGGNGGSIWPERNGTL